MYRTTLLSTLAMTGLAMAACAADTGTGTGAADPAATTTDPAPDAAATAAAAAKAAETAPAKKADKAKKDDADDGDDADAKQRYRITSEFHDRTTGRVRKKGRTLLATDERAEQLKAAKVIDPTPVDDDATDDDDDAQNADPAVNTANVAPATVGGPVDQAVIVDRGEGAAVTDGNRTGTLPKALSTSDAPAIVTGKGGKAS